MDAYCAYGPIAGQLSGNAYPGRGIVLGLSPDGHEAVCAYFLTGRSPNSQNRVLRLRGETLVTEPFDRDRVEDPSLILYTALRTCGGQLVVTNGAQTDTIAAAISGGGDFERALALHTYEPDAPNFTPRISGLYDLAQAHPAYRLSILKRAHPFSDECARHMYAYSACAGAGHLMTTYSGNGHPLPAFLGEPLPGRVPDEPEALGEALWRALDPNVRIAVYARYVNLQTGTWRDALFNRHPL